MQFSLKELLKLEDERLEEQQRTELEREAALARERAEEERRRRVEAETSARAQAEAVEQQRKTELDELTRREAMQKAIVEQGRLEVEVRARADEREHERLHELALARLRNEGKRDTSLGPLAGAVALGGGIMLAVLLTIQLGIVKPAADRRLAEVERNVAAADARNEDLARQLSDQRRLVSDRDRQLADARTEIDALKAAPKKPASPAPGSGWTSPKLGGGTTPGSKPSTQPECLAGDPMCYSMKTGR